MQPLTRFKEHHSHAGGGRSAHAPLCSPSTAPPCASTRPCTPARPGQGGLRPRGGVPAAPARPESRPQGQARLRAHFHGFRAVHSHSSSKDENLPFSLCRGLNVCLAEGEGETGERTLPHPLESPGFGSAKITQDLVRNWSKLCGGRTANRHTGWTQISGNKAVFKWPDWTGRGAEPPRPLWDWALTHSGP